MHSQFRPLTLLVCGFALLAACEQEQPVRSVLQFVENPVMLEAAMVRCSMDRDKTRYDAECINARQAVSQIEAKQEAARRVDFDIRSESKRLALRRAQEAAAKARSRATAAESLRKEAEYEAQFGVAPSLGAPLSEAETAGGNSPVAVIPESAATTNSPAVNANTAPAIDGGNAPLVDTPSTQQQGAADLDSIRDELQRRNEEDRD